MSSICESGVFNYLPDEIMLGIFQHLDLKTFITSIPVVCRRFNHLTSDQTLFEKVFRNNTGSPESQKVIDLMRRFVLRSQNLKSYSYPTPNHFDICTVKPLDGFDVRIRFFKKTNTFALEKIRSCNLNLKRRDHHIITNDESQYQGKAHSILSYDYKTDTTQVLLTLEERYKIEYYTYQAQGHLIFIYQDTLEERTCYIVAAYNFETHEILTLHSRAGLLVPEVKVKKDSLFVFIYKGIDFIERVEDETICYSLVDKKVVRFDPLTQIIHNNQILVKPKKEGFHIINGSFVSDVVLWKSHTSHNFWLSTFENQDLFPIGEVTGLYIEAESFFEKAFLIDDKFLCTRIFDGHKISTIIIHIDTREKFLIENDEEVLCFHKGYIITKSKVIDTLGMAADVSPGLSRLLTEYRI